MQWQKYNLINTPELIQALDEYLINQDGTPKFNLISFDTETNGLDLYKTVLVGFSLSVNSQQGFYIPLLEWVPDVSSQKTRTKDKVKREVYINGQLRCTWTGAFYPEDVKPGEYKIPEWVGPIMERWFMKSNLIMWNAPFDVNHTFINTGVDLKLNLVVDGGLLMHIANVN
jgi:DNA polymerase I-like protein with 3'-5' exonuclease and polymerase domains